LWTGRNITGQVVDG